MLARVVTRVRVVTTVAIVSCVSIVAVVKIVSVVPIFLISRIASRMCNMTNLSTVCFTTLTPIEGGMP